jgi:3-phenylpropionate/trans-cinnamate dioxygenase ferredoxin subunit
MRHCVVNGVDLCVCCVSDTEYYVVEGRCSHEGAAMWLGHLDGYVVECPKHNARFDVRTGEVLRKPARMPLRCFDAVQEGSCLYLRSFDDLEVPPEPVHERPR